MSSFRGWQGISYHRGIHSRWERLLHTGDFSLRYKEWKKNKQRVQSTRSWEKNIPDPSGPQVTLNLTVLPLLAYHQDQQRTEGNNDCSFSRITAEASTDGPNPLSLFQMGNFVPFSILVQASKESNKKENKQPDQTRGTPWKFQGRWLRPWELALSFPWQPKIIDSSG